MILCPSRRLAITQPETTNVFPIFADQWTNAQHDLEEKVRKEEEMKESWKQLCHNNVHRLCALKVLSQGSQMMIKRGLPEWPNSPGPPKTHHSTSKIPQNTSSQAFLFD
jgi:hypothetical protein